MNFFQSGFHVSLIGEPAETADVDDAVVIEQVTTAEAMEDYLDAYVAGWGIAEKDQPQFKGNVRPWLNQAGWSLYLARLNGQPAAAATLYLKDGVGYLADATTGPAFRGGGLQSALLRRRICDAGAAGGYRIQRRHPVLDEPPQHGARRHARALCTLTLDTGLSGGAAGESARTVSVERTGAGGVSARTHRVQRFVEERSIGAGPMTPLGVR